MHDPDTLVKDFFGIISVWHHDPCKDGTDDSCGWFKRARHGKKEVLEKIRKRFEFEWDRTFISESNNIYDCGLFKEVCGSPNFSVMGIVLNLFWYACYEHYGNRNKADKFLKNNLFDILFFAENPVDSINDEIIQKFGKEKREQRICSMASCIYGYILRREQKWYQHPRWHFWHYRLSFPIYYSLRNKFFCNNPSETSAIG